MLGKQINLTGDNTTITSNNFNVDANGNMSCNNANVLGGTVKILGGTELNPNLYVQGGSSFTKILPNDIFIDTNDGGLYINDLYDSSKHAYIYVNSRGGGITLGGNVGNDITINAGNTPTIDCYGDMYAYNYNYHSLESLKENITKLDDNMIDIVKDSEIYQFNYKNRDKNIKNYGFIIGNKGGTYKTPKEVLSVNKDSINSYSMTSILWKAVQEQQEQIEQLQNKINEMEEK